MEKIFDRTMPYEGELRSVKACLQTTFHYGFHVRLCLQVVGA